MDWVTRAKGLLPLPDVEAAGELLDLGRGVRPLPLVHQQGGQQRALGIARQPVHERLGGGLRGEPEGGENGAQAGVRHVHVLDGGQERGARLVDAEQEQEQVALGQARHGPAGGHGRGAGRGALEPGLGHPRALELLRLDPELGRVHPKLARGLRGERGGLFGVRDLRENEGHPRVGGGPPSRRREVLLGEGLLHDEGQDTPGGVEARLKGGGPLRPQEAVRVMPRRAAPPP